MKNAEWPCYLENRFYSLWETADILELHPRKVVERYISTGLLPAMREQDERVFLIYWIDIENLVFAREKAARKNKPIEKYLVPLVEDARR